MCGIFVCASKQCSSSNVNFSHEHNTIAEEIFPLIHQRGPDGNTEHTVNLPCDWKIHFIGSVLWMQGTMPVWQPVVDKNNNVLLWNGDIFDGSLYTGNDESDTSTLLSNLINIDESDSSFLELLTSIKGPYSIIYWNSRTQKLWFGRDRLGRHSLLWYFEQRLKFVLSSVGKRNIPFLEVPACGIFCIEFTEDLLHMVLYPWSDICLEVLTNTISQCPTYVTVSKIKITSPIVMRCALPYEPAKHYTDLMDQLRNCNAPEYILSKLVVNEIMSNYIDILIHHLKRAVELRVKTQSHLCKDCCKTIIHNKVSNDVEKCTHSKIGILFSGGLDSTILAAIAHEFVPVTEPIDLFNVAFDCGKRKQQNIDKEQSSDGRYPQCFETPDRVTGRNSTEELMTLFPNRQWNFINVNVETEDLEKHRKERICDLIHPLNSILDDSLGCALWFASCGRGILNNVPYISSARVLLVGMGADEQFGGYMRHRTLLRHSGWEAVANEMEMELSRIATRNLGRDDRIISDHGCQARFPFLDENVVNYLSTLPIWIRCYPTCNFPPGLGDKILLRLAALKKGLKYASTLPKRAIQFGSKIANSKEKASDISYRLTDGK